jgi:hypothetical protein
VRTAGAEVCWLLGVQTRGPIDEFSTQRTVPGAGTRDAIRPAGRESEPPCGACRIETTATGTMRPCRSLARDRSTGTDPVRSVALLQVSRAEGRGPGLTYQCHNASRALVRSPVRSIAREYLNVCNWRPTTFAQRTYVQCMRIRLH